MSEPKEVDWFLNMVAGKVTPQSAADLDDLKAQNIDFTLRDAEAYKEKKPIKEMFQTKDGKFNEQAFNNAYEAARSAYEQYDAYELAEKAVIRNKAFEGLQTNEMLGISDFKSTPTIEYNEDPYRRTRLLTSQGEPTQTETEIAQTNERWYDTVARKWQEGSVEDGILAPFKAIFNPKVIARWENNGFHKDRNGRTVAHTKGQLKTDTRSGKFYYESLGDRNFDDIVRADDVLKATNVLLRENSWASNIWDSDGKKNTLIGTGTQLAAKVLPYFTRFGKVYAGAQAALVGSEALAVYGKAGYDAFASDSTRANSELYKAFDTWRGMSKAMSYDTSEYAKQNPFTSIEGLGNALADVTGQLMQQGAVANFTNAITKSTRAGKTITASAAKTYMTLTQSQQMYEQAEAMGLPEKDRAAILGATTAVLGAIMATPVGDWFIKQPEQMNRILANDLRRVFAKEINASRELIEDAAKKYGRGSKEYKNVLTNIGSKVGTQVLDETVSKTMGKEGSTWLSKNFGKLLSTSKETMERITSPGKIRFGKFDEATGELKTSLKDYLTAFGAEAIEEESELAGEMGVKSLYNWALDNGYTQNKDKNKRFKFDNLTEEILGTAVVGGLGGALGKRIQQYNSSEFDQHIVDLMNQTGHGEIISEYILNGRTQEVLDVIDDMRQSGHFGSERFSGINVSEDGKLLPVDKRTNPDDKSIADIVTESIKNQVSGLQELYNANYDRLATDEERQTFDALEIDTDPLETLLKEQKLSTAITQERGVISEIEENEATLQAAVAQETAKGNTAEVEQLKARLEELTKIKQERVSQIEAAERELNEISEARGLFVDDKGGLKDINPKDYLKETIRHVEINNQGILFDESGAPLFKPILDENNEPVLNPDGTPQVDLVTLKTATKNELINQLKMMDNSISAITRFSKGNPVQYDSMTEEQLREEVFKRRRGKKVFKNLFTSNLADVSKRKQSTNLFKLFQLRTELKNTNNEERIKEIEDQITDLENEISSFNDGEKRLEFIEETLLRQRADLLSAFKDKEGKGILTLDELARAKYNDIAFDDLTDAQKQDVRESYLAYLQGDNTHGNYQEDLEKSLKQYQEELKIVTGDSENLGTILSKFNNAGQKTAVVSSFIETYLSNLSGLRDFDDFSDVELKAIEEAIDQGLVSESLQKRLIAKLYNDYTRKDQDGENEYDFKQLLKALNNTIEISSVYRNNYFTEDFDYEQPSANILKEDFLKAFGLNNVDVENDEIQIFDSGTGKDITSEVKNNLKIPSAKKLTFTDLFSDNSEASSIFKNKGPKLDIKFKSSSDNTSNVLKTLLNDEFNGNKHKNLIEKILKQQAKPNVIQEFINSQRTSDGRNVDELLNTFDRLIESAGKEAFSFTDETVAEKPIEELFDRLSKIMAMVETMHDNNQVLNGVAKKLGLKSKPHIDTYTRNVLFNEIKDRVRRLQYYRNLIKENNKDKTAAIKKGYLKVTLNLVGTLIKQSKEPNTIFSKFGEQFDDTLKEAVQTFESVISDVANGGINNYVLPADHPEFDRVEKLFKAVADIEDAWYDYFQTLSPTDKQSIAISVEMLSEQFELDSDNINGNNFLQYLNIISNEKTSSFKAKLLKALPEETGDFSKRKTKFAPVYTQMFHLRLLSANANSPFLTDNELIEDESIKVHDDADTDRQNVKRIPLTYAAVIDDPAGSGKSEVTIRNELILRSNENKRIGLFASGNVQLQKLVNEAVTEQSRDAIKTQGTATDFLNFIAKGLSDLEVAYSNATNFSDDITFTVGNETILLPPLLTYTTENRIVVNSVALEKATQFFINNNLINNDNLNKVDHLIFDEATNLSAFQVALVNRLIHHYNTTDGKNKPVTQVYVGDTSQIGYKIKKTVGHKTQFIDSSYNDPTLLSVRTPRGKLRLRSSYDLLNEGQEYFDVLYRKFINLSEGEELKLPTNDPLLKPFIPTIFRGNYKGKEELIGAAYLDNVDELKSLNLKPIIDRVKQEGKKIFIIVRNDFTPAAPNEDEAAVIQHLRDLTGDEDFNNVFDIIFDVGQNNSVQGAQQDYVIHLSSTYHEPGFDSGRETFTMLSRAKKAYIHVGKRKPFHQIQASDVDLINGTFKQKGYLVGETRVIDDPNKVKLLSNFALETEEGQKNVDDLYQQTRKITAAMAGTPIVGSSSQEETEEELTDEEKENLNKIRNLSRSYKTLLSYGDGIITFGLFARFDKPVTAKDITERFSAINENNTATISEEEVVDFKDTSKKVKQYVISVKTPKGTIRVATLTRTEDIERSQKLLADDLKIINNLINKATNSTLKSELQTIKSIYERKNEQYKKSKAYVQAIEKQLKTKDSITIDISKIKINKSQLKPASRKVKFTALGKALTIEHANLEELDTYIKQEEEGKSYPRIYRSKVFTITSDIGNKRFKPGKKYIIYSITDNGLNTKTADQLNNIITDIDDDFEAKDYVIIELQEEYSKPIKVSDFFKEAFLVRKRSLRTTKTVKKDLNNHFNSYFSNTSLKKLEERLNKEIFEKGKVKQELKKQFPELAKNFTELEAAIARSKKRTPSLPLYSFIINLAPASAKKATSEDLNYLIDLISKGDYKIITDDNAYNDVINFLTTLIDDTNLVDRMGYQKNPSGDTGTSVAILETETNKKQFTTSLFPLQPNVHLNIDEIALPGSPPPPPSPPPSGTGSGSSAGSNDSKTQQETMKEELKKYSEDNGLGLSDEAIEAIVNEDYFKLRQLLVNRLSSEHMININNIVKNFC